MFSSFLSRWKPRHFNSFCWGIISPLIVTLTQFCWFGLTAFGVATFQFVLCGLWHNLEIGWRWGYHVKINWQIRDINKVKYWSKDTALRDSSLDVVLGRHEAFVFNPEFAFQEKRFQTFMKLYWKQPFYFKNQTSLQYFDLRLIQKDRRTLLSILQCTSYVRDDPVNLFGCFIFRPKTKLVLRNYE